MSRAEPGSILFTGAGVGDVVEGMTNKNLGLLLKLRQEQIKGENGWLKGRFDVLEAGTGPYAAHMEPFIGQTFNALELMQQILDSLGATTTTRLTIFDRNSLRVQTPNAGSPNPL